MWLIGITPACAGKRVFPGTHIPAVWDHPRVCGEKKGLCAADEPRQGSPPRVRGKGGVLTGRVGAQRITPACAGKSKPRRHGSPSAGDHPRVCGEKSNCIVLPQDDGGSPPRVRGKGVKDLLPWLCIGITPACAGKRDCKYFLGCGSRDHPRVCGEKSCGQSGRPEQAGSPPRVRGKVGQQPVIVVLTGITPACAGKRLKRSHRIGHFSCILCLFHSVLHRASASGGSRAGPCAPPCLPAQNAIPV